MGQSAEIGFPLSLLGSPVGKHATAPWITTLTLLALGDRRRLRIWSQMAGLLQDGPCQIQMDITHRQILNPVRRKENFCVHFCFPLIKNDVFCQPKVGCYSDASWDFCSQAS